MKIQKITEFKTSEWAGGSTTELFIYPPNSDYLDRNFLFRLSSATVETDKSVFSDLSGYKRYIAPLEGRLNISHDEKNFKSLAINELYTFDGAIKTVSTGKCRDFNFMLKDGHKGFANYTNLIPLEDLVLECEEKEIVWLFSYKNKPTIQVSVKDKIVDTLNLTQMSLLVFSPDKENRSSNLIQISPNQSVSLFYGKVIID
ncbi:HutD protein [Balneicella halophila]|uniref:HutD protein n=1 Tax=Balneicella halophila TaxID=1537566 RepID=A0A7L4UP93_BALHA|nr:HutD family protein [Balneicella halophila]PVX50854.1 HutD protein [Balneicella halophila]